MERCIFLSVLFQLCKVYLSGGNRKWVKGSQCMKRFSVLNTLLWLVGLLVLLYGCTGPSQSQKQAPAARTTSSYVPPTQLKPEGSIPSSCPATPVYQGGQGTLLAVPWIEAQPVSSGIRGYLFYAQSATTKSGTYRFLHTGGNYPDGSTTKILWIVDHPHASGPLQIDGTNLSHPGKTFHQTIDGEGEIPSIVVIPSTGCWHLQISSGSAKGSIILWVAE